MTKTAHEPKRPIVRVQNGLQLGQKRDHGIFTLCVSCDLFICNRHINI